MPLSPLGTYVQLTETDAHPHPPRILRELGEIMVSQSPANGAAQVNAAYVYFGQFIAHDLTKFEHGNSDPKPDRRLALYSLNSDVTPRFDLDCVYGLKNDDPRCPREKATGYLQLRKTIPSDSYDAEEDDLPRSEDETLTALIPDVRNDENLFVAQIHVLFHKLHNHLVDIIRGQFVLHPHAAFQAARSETVNIYQEIVLRDFLPQIVDEEMYQLCLEDVESRFFKVDTNQLPIEFTAAAFRFGHSMVLPQYPQKRSKENLFVRDLFELTGGREEPFGGRRGLPAENVVDWDLMLSSDLTKASLIDPALFDDDVPVPLGQIRNLAIRNLYRGNEVGLPSAQDLIRALEKEHPVLHGKLLELEPRELAMLDLLPNNEDRLALKRHTPLWYYILVEASSRRHAGGRKLGKLGSFIVCATIFGIMRSMPESIVNTGWKPRQLIPGDGREFFSLPGLVKALN